MSPYQHSEVGIAVFKIGLIMRRSTSRQNSALLCLPFQMRKFLNDIVAFSSALTNVNGRAWVRSRIVILTLDHAADGLKLSILPTLLGALLRGLALDCVMFKFRHALR